MFIKSKANVVLALIIFITASTAVAGGIKVLAPLDGANMPSKDIVIIGSVSSDAKEVVIKGTAGDPIKVKVDHGAFFAKVKLGADKNELAISSDDGSSVTLKINVSNENNFNYHPDIDELSDCTSTCHTEVSSKGYVNKRAAAICYECHDANNEKEFVHGPVNLGICEVCHTPHGSSHSGFLVMDKNDLCSGCHESLIEKHPETANKICVDCHDPHSSDKEFHIK